jgi:hypothetical protein
MTDGGGEKVIKNSFMICIKISFHEKKTLEKLLPINIFINDNNVHR